MKVKRVINTILFLIVVTIITLLWTLVSFKSVLLSTGIFSLLMYFNITTTSLGNAFIGRDFNRHNDVFWRILFILISSLSFGIYFNI